MYLSSQSVKVSVVSSPPTYRLSSIRTVSIVYSRRQLARHGSFVGSTLYS